MSLSKQEIERLNKVLSFGSSTEPIADTPPTNNKPNKSLVQATNNNKQKEIENLERVLRDF